MKINYLKILAVFSLIFTISGIACGKSSEDSTSLPVGQTDPFLGNWYNDGNKLFISIENPPIEWGYPYLVKYEGLALTTWEDCQLLPNQTQKKLSCTPTRTSSGEGNTLILEGSIIKYNIIAPEPKTIEFTR